jgi:hypothetical protein
MSRQSDWQNRQIKQGRCRICGKERESDDPQLCEKHRKMSRDAKARRRKAKLDGG